MSILETFYILFKSDASDVKKGADEAKRSTDNLNASLKATDVGASKVASSFGAIASSVAGAVAAFISVGSIISGISAAATRASELGLLSKQLGISTEALDVWGAAVVKVGGTAQGFQKSIEGLSSTFNISGQRALDLLPRLADSFSKVNFQRAKIFGAKLGIDEGTIMLLQRGRREMDSIIARQKELGAVTKQDAEIAQKFNQQWQDTDRIFKSFYTSIASSILPILTAVGKVFEDIARYFRLHSDLIIGSLLGIASVITIALLPAILSMAVAAAPFLLVAAAIGTIGVAIGLVYEDIKYFREGNKSLIGDIIERWPKVAIVAKEIAAIVKDAFNGILETIKLVVDGFKSVNSFFLGIENKVIDHVVSLGKNALDFSSNHPISSQSSNSIISSSSNSNRSTVVNTGPITIQTSATDAQGISYGLEGGLRQALQQANAGLDDGRVA